MKKTLDWSLAYVPHKTLTIFYNGEMHIVADSGMVEKTLAAIRSGDKTPEDILRIFNPSYIINSHKSGAFEVVNGVVHLNGEAVPNAISNKILRFSEDELDATPLISFWKLLKENPSYSSKKQLFNFIERNNVPLVGNAILTFADVNGEPETVDCQGFIVAWKAVRDNFLDIYSGTVLNKPGTFVEMDRGDVDDDPNSPCSSGLHAGAWSYVSSYGDESSKIVKVYINPADVVSVPKDSSYTKIRTCKYYVVEEVCDKGEVSNLEKEIVEKGADFEGGGEDERGEFDYFNCEYFDDSDDSYDGDDLEDDGSETQSSDESEEPFPETTMEGAPLPFSWPSIDEIAKSWGEMSDGLRKAEKDFLKGIAKFSFSAEDFKILKNDNEKS